MRKDHLGLVIFSFALVQACLDKLGNQFGLVACQKRQKTELDWTFKTL
jgi:hypothetical protein